MQVWHNAVQSVLSEKQAFDLHPGMSKVNVVTFPEPIGTKFTIYTMFLSHFN